MLKTYGVIWFYCANWSTDDVGKPRVFYIEAINITDAIEHGVFWRSDEFRAKAHYVVIRPDGSTWIGQWADLTGEEE